MFSPEYYNFQYPLFVTSVHMIVQFFFSGTSLVIYPKLRPSKIPSKKDYIYKVLPCAFATSFDIGLSNLSLKTITLSFYTMCKSSTLAFVLIFAFIFGLEKPTWKLILIIVIISIGVILMVSEETEFSWIGFIQVMLASAFGGLRWSLTEVLLRRESMGLTNPFVSILFLAPAQAIILLVLAAIVEGYITIFKSVFFITFSEGIHTIGIILLGGSLAFFMIMSEFFLIKRTSVVTLSVCGIFKEVATIFVASTVFGDVLTVLNIIGLSITLFGIALYNWLKFHLMAKAKKSNRNNEYVEAGQEEESEEEYPKNTSHQLFLNPSTMANNKAAKKTVTTKNDKTQKVDNKTPKHTLKVASKKVDSSDSESEDLEMNEVSDDEDFQDIEESDEEMEGSGESEESEEDDDIPSKPKQPKKYSTEAFSEAMTKILASSLSGSAKRQPILARSKGIERKIEDEKLDYKARKILSAEKRMLKDKGRVIPDFTTYDYEKKLRKVATRGVVKLFNAVRTQQKLTEVAVQNASETRKTAVAIEKAKDVSTMSKTSFLELLKTGQK
ncbi:Rrp15p-domain-containing protein [Pilobolus umbonatus]|nr:Rrp15p-domain-containing protein [Pilobolus umbonatus]